MGHLKQRIRRRGIGVYPGSFNIGFEHAIFPELGSPRCLPRLDERAHSSTSHARCRRR